MNADLAVKPVFDLSPHTFEQALTFAGYLAESDLVPKDFKSKPGNCLIAMQWGAEVGLKPMQAMQNIAVINGRPTLWGDAVIAIARAHPACEYIIEEDDGTTATCRLKRRGEAEQVRTFSVEDARVAGLAGKQGPWTQYPKRMRQMRARGFGIRDVFPDALKGFPMAEEVMDAPKSMGIADVVTAPNTQQTPPQTPAVYDAAKFEANLPKWGAVIESGRKTAADIIAMATSVGALTGEQKQKIKQFEVTPATQSMAAPTAATQAILANELPRTDEAKINPGSI